MTKFVVLDCLNIIIEDHEVIQGYVSKEDILNVYHDMIKTEDITENSFIVESCSPTYIEYVRESFPLKSDGINETVEIRRLVIK